jgi:hypothetical protein
MLPLECYLHIRSIGNIYEWAEEARKRRDLCVKGEISIEDFKLWLEE